MDEARRAKLVTEDFERLMDLYRRPLLAAADDLRRRLNNILGSERPFLHWFAEGRRMDCWCGGVRGGRLRQSSRHPKVRTTQVSSLAQVSASSVWAAKVHTGVPARLTPRTKKGPVSACATF
jgi:hypothetical protein